MRELVLYAESPLRGVGNLEVGWEDNELSLCREGDIS